MNSILNFDYFRDRALAGDPESQLAIAEGYYDGLGLEKNCALGKEWAEKAATKEWPEAQLKLGHWLVEEASWAFEATFPPLPREDGTGLIYLGAKPFEDQFDEFLSQPDMANFAKKIIKKAKSRPLFQIGQKKMAQGLRWLEKAADHNLAQAQYELGQLSLRLPPFPFDVSKSISLLNKAANQDNSKAMYLLAKIYFRRGSDHSVNPFSAMRLLMEASRLGEPRAHSDLAMYILYQEQVTEEQKKEAVQLLEKAAENGIPMAIFNLAVNLYLGIGVEKDRERAISLCRKVSNPYVVGNKAMNKVNMTLEKMLAGANDL
ncbi:MAG: hypothetical protein LBS60_07665 [Deltaproteobacteria bacterium]|jgi:TPR repeat protein|nr:hypothetical protein [Deltaproteobacteria bacterium]